MTLNKKSIAIVAFTSAIAGSIGWSLGDHHYAAADTPHELIADAPADSDASSSPSSSSAPLQAGVQKVELSLEKLRDVGLDLKQVTTSARHLYDEVTIQPVSLMTMPEVIGRATIVNIPVSTMPAGPPAPPNPKRVAQAMNGMRPIINTLKENADDFVAQHKVIDVSDEAREKLQPVVKSWVEAADNIAGQLKNLEPLTTGPKYDNTAIATICKNIQQDAYVMDTLRRNAYKIIKKENKDKEKAAKADRKDS